MKNKMQMEISNISNQSRRRNYEIEDMSKPSEKVRLEGLKRTQHLLNHQVGKQTEAAYVSISLKMAFNNYFLQ
jgi:hypothetical protein